MCDALLVGMSNETHNTQTSDKKLIRVYRISLSQLRALQDLGYVVMLTSPKAEEEES